MRKRIHLLVTLVFVLSVLVNSSGNAQAGVSELETKLEQAEILFRSYDAEKLKEAKSIYDELIKIYPDKAEVYWKAARCSNNYSAYSDNPLQVLEEGKRLVEKSIELNPNNADSYFWSAVLMARIGQEKGVLKSLFMVKPMKKALDTCLEINPNYAYAYHMLSTLYINAPGWPLSIGDKGKAVECQEKAVELEPTSFTFQWGLYEVYSKVGKKDEAREILQRIVEMPNESDQTLNRTESIEIQQEIKEKAKKALR